MKNHIGWFSYISSFLYNHVCSISKKLTQNTNIKISIHIITSVQNSYESFSITQGCMLIWLKPLFQKSGNPLTFIVFHPKIN